MPVSHLRYLCTHALHLMYLCMICSLLSSVPLPLQPWGEVPRRLLLCNLLQRSQSQLLHHDIYLKWSAIRPPDLRRDWEAEQKKGQMRVVSAIMKNIMHRIVGRGMGRGQNERQKEQKQKNNTRDSNVVPHRSTNLARQCLTSLSRREAVLSLWYGRSCRIVTTQTL